MIIVNGYFKIVQKTGGGIADGIPQPVAEQLSQAHYCNIKVISRNYEAETSNGNAYTEARYEILTDADVLLETEIEVTDLYGHDLGRCRVKNIEHCECVGANKLDVRRYANKA